MKARIGFGFGFLLWTSLLVGAVQLFRVAAGPVVIGGGALAGLLIARMYLALRRRVRRLRTWKRPGAPELYPTGPRRVLLAHTGLATPRSRVR